MDLPRTLPNATGRRLLAVFAHPDDETFGTGGTLALYSRCGVEVHLICATGGEVGAAPADFKGFNSVGEMREAELRSAASILGLRAVHFLGYRDSGMAGSPDNSHPQALTSAPPQEVACQVASYIRQFLPQVIITFDPIGGYRHPDHIAVHQATVAAFAMAGDPTQDINNLPPYSPQKLYYSTFSRRSLRWLVRLMRLLGHDPHRFGRNGDIDIVSLANVDFPIHASIPIRAVRRQKEEAASLHSSQIIGTSRLRRWLQHLFSGTEKYMRAIPVQMHTHIERDLFEGVYEIDDVATESGSLSSGPSGNGD